MSDITVTLTVEKSLHDKLRELAEKEHRSLAGQIRFILEDFIS